MSSDGARFWEGDDWGWRPLWLTANQVVEHAHACFGVAVGAAVLLAGGLLNQTWLLRSRDRDRVLRVGRPDRSLDQVRWEHVVSRTWATRVPQVVVAEADPVAVVPDQGQTHVLSIFPSCAGVPGTVVPAALRVEHLAPAMAAMHRTALGLDPAQRPGMTCVDDEPIGPRWLAVRAAVENRFGQGPDVARVTSVVDDAVGEVDSQIQRWRTTGRLEPRAAVHADLNVRNQLYRDGRLVGIIDTDDCRIEPLAWEVAGLAYSDPTVPPDAAWDLYQQADGPLHAADRELLLPFARLAVLGELQWITDGDTGEATHLGMKTSRSSPTASPDLRHAAEWS